MWDAVGQRGDALGWSPSATLEKCIGEAQKIDRCWGKRMARERRLRLEMLHAGLARAQLALEAGPDDATSQVNVTLAKEALLSFCAAQANWVELVMQSRWLMEGNTGLSSSTNRFVAWRLPRTFTNLWTRTGM